MQASEKAGQDNSFVVVVETRRWWSRAEKLAAVNDDAKGTRGHRRDLRGIQADELSEAIRRLAWYSYSLSTQHQGPKVIPWV
jgi:hypothetical protein